MDIFAIYILIFFNAWFLYYCIRTLPAINRFLSIILIPFIFYFLNYPLRAFILINSEECDYSSDQIFLSLLYATVFTIILFISYKKNVNKDFFCYKPDKIQIFEKDEFLCHITFVITISVFVYRMVKGKLFGLYDDESSLYDTFGGNFINMFNSLKWFCVASSAIIYFKNKQKKFFIELFAVSTVIIFEAIASTSKGPVVALLLFYLFMKSINNNKVNYLFLFVVSIVVYFYMKLTYLIRYYGVVRGEFNFVQMINNYKDLTQILNANDYMANTSGSVANRFNYLDGLILTMQEVNIHDNGIYDFGGIAEILNVFPRYLWEGRPLINFNMYLTHNVWGNVGSVAEMPIGRIGESFFVLGYAGILYALFYGILFATTENIVFKRISVTYLAMYFVILYYYVWSDAHVLFYWKTIVWNLLVIIAINFIYNHVYNNYFRSHDESC